MAVLVQRPLISGMMPPRHGDVVVLDAPYRPGDVDALRVKRAPGEHAVVRTRRGFLQPMRKHQYWLEADHGASQVTEDSEAFGGVTNALIRGTARAILWPPQLAGVVRRRTGTEHLLRGEQ